MADGQATHLAPEGTSELVKVSSLQLRLEPCPLAGRPGPVGRGPGAVLRRPFPIGRGLGTQLLELVVQPCLTFARRQFQIGRVCVPPPASLVADLRHPIPLDRRLVPLGRGRLAADPVGEALERSAPSILPRTRVCLRVVGRQVALRRTVLVSRLLVMVRWE